MSEDGKTILDLGPQAARAFFLKEEQYISFELPPYITFKKLLDEVLKNVGNKGLKDLCLKAGDDKTVWPSDFDGVNYKLLVNRDGRFSWRPYSFIHPVLYVLLVNLLTEPTTWSKIRARFVDFQQDQKIVCTSIAGLPTENTTAEATQVSRWVQNVERRSIELSLKFRYLFHTDVVDCYGSYYSHSISWALHGKAWAKANRDKGVGRKIDQMVQAMSYGQTNGIPQGSAVMDLIAELIMGYIDSLLSEALTESNPDFQILRHRDDYRVFVNDASDGERILKILSEILAGLGLRLNPHKTWSSGNVVEDSVKKDKLAWQRWKTDAKTLLERIQLLHQFSREFPNSGTLEREISKLFQNTQFEGKADPTYLAVAAILCDIAIHNPRTIPGCAAILSQVIAALDDDAGREEILEDIRGKFDTVPNTGFLQLWLQRISLAAKLPIEYEEPLCRRVHDKDVALWNSDWLTPDLKKCVEETSIIRQDVIDEIPTEISANEFAIFILAKQYQGYLL